MTDEQARRDLLPLIEEMKAGRFDEAVEGLKKYLETYPDHEVGLGLLASACFQIGLTDKARPLYERMLTRYPANALARFQLGMLCLAQRDFREAIETWRPLLGAEGEFMANFHSALAHLQLEDAAAARPLLDKAARNVPLSHPLAAEVHAAQTRLNSERMESGSAAR